jgi:hypothetical protein
MIRLKDHVLLYFHVISCVRNPFLSGARLVEAAQMSEGELPFCRAHE